MTLIAPKMMTAEVEDWVLILLGAKMSRKDAKEKDKGKWSRII